MDFNNQQGEQMTDKDNHFSEMTEEQLEQMWDEEAKQEQKEEDDAIAEAEEGDPEAEMEQQLEDEAIAKAEEGDPEAEWEAQEEERQIEKQIEKEEEEWEEKQIAKKKTIKGFIEMFGIRKDIHGRPINAETEVAGHFAGDYILKAWPDGSCERCYPGHPDFPKNKIN